MTTLARFAGILLLILVGYHYINHPLGLTVAGSVAVAIFGGCLTLVYRGYEPDAGNWIGWVLIAGGCLILATFSSFRLWLVMPGLLVVLGFRLAGLSLDLGSAGGHGGDGGGGFIDFGGGDGGDGGD